MISPIFILPEVLVKAHQDDVRRTAADAHLSRLYSPWPRRFDALLALTGEALIRLGTQLKMAHRPDRAVAGFTSTFDPCEGKV